MRLSDEQAAPTSTEQQYLDRFVKEYTSKTRSSAAQREATWPVLADARSSQGFSLQAPAAVQQAWLATKQLRYPIVAERCQGAEVWDIDGNRYLDYCMGFGVFLFGHRPEFVQAALREQLDRGLPIGYQSKQVNEVAAAVCALTGAQRVAFCNTGAEANMGAIRLARAATGRDTIVVFAQSYHGSYDAVLPAIGMLRGLSGQQKADTLVLEYGAASSLETIARHADQIAAVVVEPVQARSPGLQPSGFLRELRKLTQEKDVALIFDDVLLGFRVHAGGSQAYFDIRADLATYGKILGGGMPIGVITGSARFLDQIDGGKWSANDESGPRAEKIWFAGTFTKNPLTMAAAHAVTTHLLAAGNALQEALNAKTAGLAARLNEWLKAEAMPVRLEHFGSLFRFMAAPKLWILLPHLRMRGVYAFDGMTGFVSTAHSDADLAYLEDAVKDSLHAMRSGGYLE